MYEIIKNVIESKDYKLEDILYKISKMYIEDRITEAEKSELDKMARFNAVAKNSYASADERIENIYEELKNIKSRLTDLENKDTSEEGTPEDTIEPIEEYPEYVQPTGAHDSYNKGDKVTYNGKKYTCIMDNCVWSPDTYPAGWELVEENISAEV